jgi:hypothetical protein
MYTKIANWTYEHNIQQPAASIYQMPLHDYIVRRRERERKDMAKQEELTYIRRDIDRLTQKINMVTSQLQDYCEKYGEPVPRTGTIVLNVPKLRNTTEVI